jgi:hypothetical protein
MATTPHPEPSAEPRREPAEQRPGVEAEVWEMVKPVHPRARFRRFGWRLSRPWRGI